MVHPTLCMLGAYRDLYGSVRHFKNDIFDFILLIGIFRSSNDYCLRWMPRNVTDDKSTLVQVKPSLPEPMLTQFYAAI